MQKRTSAPPRRGPWARRRAAAADRGPLVVSASLDELLNVIRAVDPELPWADLQSSVLPLFRRRRPMPGRAEASLYLERPPGLDVGIGVDIGPAFLHVSAAILKGWGVTAEQALARAIENVRGRAAMRGLEPIVYGEVAGVPCGWFQSGQSIGSALLLLPDEIEKRFGPQPQLLVAPMRDLLVSMPASAGLEFATALRESIAEEDPNCLDLPVFSLSHGLLRICEQPTDTARSRWTH